MLCYIPPGLVLGTDANTDYVPWLSPERLVTRFDQRVIASKSRSVVIYEIICIPLVGVAEDCE